MQPDRIPATRKPNGSTLADFGPALLILFILIFFPLLDLLGICLDYGLCMILNYNQVHEASLIPSKDATDEAGPIKKTIVDQWSKGMGSFVGLAKPITTTITYTTAPQEDASNNADKSVKVVTTVVCSPFLTIPIPFVHAPGFNEPFTFEIASERQMENPDYAPQ